MSALQGALLALLFGEAWSTGWRPGQPATIGDLTLLARHQITVGLKEDPPPRVPFWGDAYIVAPLWLGTQPPPSPHGSSEEETTFLLMLNRVRLLGQRPLEGRQGPLSRHLLPTRKPRPAGLVLHARVLQALEELVVIDAADWLSDLDLLWVRHPWLAKAGKPSEVHVHLVLALLACEAAGFTLARALDLVTEAEAPAACPAVALLCEARFPGAVPPSWRACLSDRDLATLDAVCLADEAASGEGRCP